MDPHRVRSLPGEGSCLPRSILETRSCSGLVPAPTTRPVTSRSAQNDGAPEPSARTACMSVIFNWAHRRKARPVATPQVTTAVSLRHMSTASLALYGDFFHVIRLCTGKGPVPCLLALARIWPELAAERRNSALDRQRQDEQASKGTPLVADAVGARGVSMQPPRRQEGHSRDPERKGGVPQLLVFPRLHAATVPGARLTCRCASLVRGQDSHDGPPVLFLLSSAEREAVSVIRRTCLRSPRMPNATDPPPTARMPWAGIKPVPGQHPSRQNIPLRAATSAETPYARTAQIGGSRVTAAANVCVGHRDLPCAWRFQSASVRGSPNRGSTELSNRVIALTRSPERVMTNRPKACAT